MGGLSSLFPSGKDNNTAGAWLTTGDPLATAGTYAVSSGMLKGSGSGGGQVGDAITAPGKIAYNSYKPSGQGGSSYQGGGGTFDPSNPFANGVGAGGDPYNQLRNNAGQEASNNHAQGMDAISRRFAAMGGSGSGAEIQAMTDLNRNAAGARESAVGNINAAEQGQAKDYAQMKQQASQFGQGQDLAREQLGEQSSEFGANLQLGENQQAMDAQANNINARIAGFQANNSGGLFGGGGFLGLGMSQNFKNDPFGGFGSSSSQGFGF